MQQFGVAIMILGAILAGAAILGLVIRKVIGAEKLTPPKANEDGKQLDISYGIVSVLVSSVGAIAHVYNYVAFATKWMEQLPIAYGAELILVPFGIGLGVTALVRGAKDRPALGGVGAAIGLGIGIWFFYLVSK